jgi:hypothetical protein
MYELGYFCECADCGEMTGVWDSGRGLICPPCAIGHMDRADERIAALEKERDIQREFMNIRMAELGEEVDQLKEEAERREAVIVKMREALSVAGVCDLCGEEVERTAAPAAPVEDAP